MTRCSGSLITLAVVLLALDAGAQEPKFEYGKKEEVKAVEWKASAQAGLILTTGNSRSLAFSAGATASRKAGDNKLSVDASAAYARSEILVAVDGNANGTIGPTEITRSDATTANNWLLKLRYDRFFTEHDSAYLSGRIGADEMAGKELYGGGQIGYSRLLYKTEAHELAAEAGYDFTYESYVAKTVDALAIHSARLFAGYTAKLTEVTGFLLNAELLLNLNTEKGPTGEIGTFEDARFIAKAALTTKIVTRIDLRLAATLKFDNAPAPQPPFKIAYDPGFIPLADKTDFITEAVIVANFL